MKQALAPGAGETLEVAEAAVRASLGDDADMAVALVAANTPERWPLEWGLPVWLGADLGAQLDVVQELAASNLIGLAALRLEDDLADGEGNMPAGRSARALGARLLEIALSPYWRMFGPSHPWWGYYERCMTEWRVAVHASASTAGGLPFAARAAPSKVAAVALCHLAERGSLIQPLNRALDHALAGMVLVDHRTDWQADLTGGRWNAFIDALAGPRSSPLDIEGMQSRVLAELLIGRKPVEYSGRIEAEFDAAIRLASELALGALAAGLAGIRARVDDHSTAELMRQRELGNRATELVFGRQ